ncbi:MULTISPECIES: hypothetical protein [unclassified Roseovarius]|uniref:hypothetical protein n=1 Tax=unclassified Roseovarius TaxID=2614913 RepID=UPI00273D6C81|nr:MULTISPECIES: hypothetical protein [unclassified Roseovarius]
MIANRRRVLRLGAAAAMVPALALPAGAQSRLHQIAIHGFLFGPDRLMVRVGDKVRFTNHDLAPHTATATDGSWDTGTLEQGQHADLMVTDAWGGDYFCAHHPAMTARLEIMA